MLTDTRLDKIKNDNTNFEEKIQKFVVLINI